MERDVTDIGWKRSRLKYAPVGMRYFDHSKGPGGPLLSFLLVLLSGSLVLSLGCDPYSDIRAELSPDERVVFQRGQRAATACWTCHDLTGSGSKVGPPLSGVIGRAIGSLPTYAYSDALRASSGVWDRRSLDVFLADVQGSIPGNRMTSPGVTNRTERAALIFFLEKVTPTD